MSKMVYNNIIRNTGNSSVFTEAFYGKSTTLKELERVMDTLIVDVRSRKIKNPSTSDTNKYIEKLICKQFGFKQTIIKWTILDWNVKTLVGSNVFMTPGLHKVLTNKDKGYYDTTHTDVCIIDFNVDILKRCNLTGAEAVAILLHEVGHNFDYSMYAFLDNLIHSIITNEPLYIPINEVINTTQVKPIYNTLLTLPDSILMINGGIHDFISGFSYLVRTLGKTIKRFLSPLGLLMVPLTVLIAPQAQFINLAKTKREGHADSFAVAYGYGSELANAMIKLENDSMYSHDMDTSSLCPISKFMLDLTVMENDLINSLLNPYGSAQSRLTKSITVLENDINSTTDPRIKAQLTAEVSKLQGIYKIHLACNDDEKMAMSKSYRKFIAKHFNGDPSLAKFLPSNVAGDPFAVINR